MIVGCTRVKGATREMKLVPLSLSPKERRIERK